MNPVITRGLWLPDPNFRFGTGTGSAWTEGSAVVGDIEPRPSAIGSGQSMRVALSGLAFGANDYIETQYTPYGVAAAPFLAGSSNINFVIMAAVKTEDVAAGNTNELIQGNLYGVNSSGTAVSSAINFSFTDTDSVTFKVSDDEWTLIVCPIDIGTNSSIVQYKLRLTFQNASAGGTNYLHLGWVGLSVPYDLTATVGDTFTSFYADDVSLGTQENPLGVGGLVRNWSLPWPHMDSADKAIIDECIAWNSRTPRSGIKSNSDGSYQDMSNNGDMQPLIVAIDREDYKGAFYANMPSKPGFSPAGGGGYWPSTGAKHATSLTFIEQDRPRV